jgi:hypothetical protein
MVVSRDPPPLRTNIAAQQLFELCRTYPVKVPHAISFKADGHQSLLHGHLLGWTAEQYVCLICLWWIRRASCSMASLCLRAPASTSNRPRSCCPWRRVELPRFRGQVKALVVFSVVHAVLMILPDSESAAEGSRSAASRALA